MSIIQWMHFSDLHLNKGGVETRRLRNKLPEYLESLNIHCDYAFCTGDIRFAPSGKFPDDSADRIKTICDSVHVPLQNLYLVPGNHDIDRNYPDRVEAIHRVHYTNGHGNPGYYQPMVGKIDLKDLNAIAQGQEEYAELLGKLYADIPGRASLHTSAEHPHFTITTDNLNIVHLDSTITYLKDQQRDFIVGTELLMDALEQTDKTKPTVLLTHYSFDFLDRNEQNQIIQLLKDYHVQLWLAGHEHDHLCRKQWDYFYEFQCGNLMLEDGATSCVLIGSLDLDTGAGGVHVHAWFPQGGWVEYPFVRTGSDRNSVYPFQLDLPSRSPTTAMSTEKVNALEACQTLEAAGGQFSQVEFYPQLMPDLQQGQELYKNMSDQIPLISAMDAMWQNKQRTGEACHALLLGDGGMGKSTVMYYACKHVIQERHGLAVFASLQALQSAGLGIERHMLRTLYRREDESSRNCLLQLTSESSAQPNLVLFVDGFNELTGDTAYQYAAELKRISQYPGVQIVVSSRLDFLRNFGMTHFQMLRTCDLRDVQIATLFSPDEWKDILGKRHLHILLKNPMMALLYAQTYPLIDRYRDLEYCDWRLPISNATDLLHDFYLAQVALVLERENAGKESVYYSFCAVKHILPHLAFQAENNNVMGWSGSEFESQFSRAIQEGNEILFGGALPAPLEQIKRTYRLKLGQALPNDEIYNVILSEMCLLCNGNGKISFHHQIFRDYLAAVYLYDRLLYTEDGAALWRNLLFHKGVTQHLQHIHGELWGKSGLIPKLLAPYRGKEIEPGDYYVENLINCWLPEETDQDVIRDLSELDLQNISLADHLKRPYNGSILLNGARVSKQTFVNEQRHDRIIDLAFSHDGRMLAAVSVNGIVSVSNILTQSQMIVGRLDLDQDTTIGYTSGDYLMLKTGSNAYIWPTIAYDKIETARPGDAILTIPGRAQYDDDAARLQKMLKDSALLGVKHIISDDRLLLAVGHSSGHIQIWDVREQNCVAELTLGDSQVITASFSRGGELAALCAGGPLVQLWNVKQKKCVGVLRFDQPVRRVRFPATVNFESEPFLECEYSDGLCFRRNLQTGELEEYKNSKKLLQIQKKLRDRLGRENIQKIDLADNGNGVIMAKNSNKLWVWNQETHALNSCTGHMTAIQDVAVCAADPRYAASYSDEKFRAKRKEDRRLEGEKIVRTWAIRKGNCMHRLSTKQRSIKRLQFFTANRIILAGFATNGDIILWELINKFVNGIEHGHWNLIDIVRNSPAEPLECAVATQEQLFIGVYTDGTLFSRTFSGTQKSSFTVFPGIDLTPIKWDDLICSDEIKKILCRYKQETN